MECDAGGKKLRQAFRFGVFLEDRGGESVEFLACVDRDLELHLIGEKPRRFLRAPPGAAEDEPLPAVDPEGR